MKTSRYIIVLLAVLIASSFIQPFRALANITEAQDAARRRAWPMANRGLKEKDPAAFVELASFLKTNEYAFFCYHPVLDVTRRLDGLDMLSKGSPEMLAITRDFLDEVIEKDQVLETVAPAHGLVYLAQKGDALDVPLMKKYLTVSSVKTNEHLTSIAVGMPLRILQARVAGTNVIKGLFDQKYYPDWVMGNYDLYSTNYLGFLPSVANTGPQAAYVYVALGLALNKWCASDMPSEILTMRVWFDAKGKAVTDTDLSKYGISVPGLGLASLDSITNAPPAEPPQEPIPALPAKEKVPAVPLILGMGVLAGLFFVVRFLKRR